MCLWRICVWAWVNQTTLPPAFGDLGATPRIISTHFKYQTLWQTRHSNSFRTLIPIAQLTTWLQKISSWYWPQTVTSYWPTRARSYRPFIGSWKAQHPNRQPRTLRLWTWSLAFHMMVVCHVCSRTRASGKPLTCSDTTEGGDFGPFLSENEMFNK